jgi:hypothetical protein
MVRLGAEGAKEVPDMEKSWVRQTGWTDEESPLFVGAAVRVVVPWRTAPDRGSAVGSGLEAHGEGAGQARRECIRFGTRAARAFQDSAADVTEAGQRWPPRDACG